MIMKNKLLSLLLALPVFSANADMLLGADIEVNAWNQDYEFNDQGSGDDVNYTLEASIEHPIPLIPNIKYAHSSADANNFKYTKQDLTLYYELLDNDLVSLDIGAGLTYLSKGELNNQTFEGYVPYLYAATEIGIPGTPLFIFGKGSGISYSDYDMLDASAGLQYEIGMGLFDVELQIGYRIQTFNLKSFDNLTTTLDTETSGYYAGVNVDF
ncbi:TIGR04219 family outer membrane beta-barrel protein [Vibrio salinus]|uniref:TIGR04219 family outer membrane beta-barrel protein n=1 Tax=Vibrio salinus TaxID=2899784 RepID=UPI001E6046CF|nr:TIGR04219 family outer membrane beta-barrel protein [Vibrio salinus]MCE0495485.1 TIGR04219 family outer membrane beta-barrel protein [Vibrio salinus]